MLAFHRVAFSVVVCSTCLFLLTPRNAAADGWVVVDDPSVEVQATAQRAVLWLRQGTWEIHIQPQFPRERGRGAWVVPFPVQPTVELSSNEFFDQLELLTSPVFYETCSLPCCDDDCWDGAEEEISDLPVDVWEQGTVGDLDYAILSAQSGDQLVAWLNVEGFAVPLDAQELIGEFETQGVFFFAARLSEEIDPKKPIAPVRFILPGVDAPSYPLRMTGLAVPEDAHLALTAWVVFPWGPLNQGLPVFVPASHPYGNLGTYPLNADAYRRAIDAFFAREPGGFVVIYASQYLRTEFPFPDYDPVWCPEIREIQGDGHILYRYQARLDTQTLAADLVLRPQDDKELWPRFTENEYENYIGDCYPCPEDDDDDDDDDADIDGGEDLNPVKAQSGCSTAVISARPESPAALLLRAVL